MIVTPIHTAALGGKPLRFFRSPLTSEPDLPWHSFDDMQACLALPRSLRRDFLRKLKGAWKGDVRTVATPDGITTIAPHFMAQGVIDAMVAVGHTPQRFYVEYAHAGAVALKAITASMGQIAGFEWAMAAAKRTLAGDDRPAPGPGGAA